MFGVGFSNMPIALLQDVAEVVDDDAKFDDDEAVVEDSVLDEGEVGKHAEFEVFCDGKSGVEHDRVQPDSGAFDVWAVLKDECDVAEVVDNDAISDADNEVVVEDGALDEGHSFIRLV